MLPRRTGPALGREPGTAPRVSIAAWTGGSGRRGRRKNIREISRPWKGMRHGGSEAEQGGVSSHAGLPGGAGDRSISMRNVCSGSSLVLSAHCSESKVSSHEAKALHVKGPRSAVRATARAPGRAGWSSGMMFTSAPAGALDSIGDSTSRGRRAHGPQHPLRISGWAITPRRHGRVT